MKSAYIDIITYAIGHIYIHTCAFEVFRCLLVVHGIRSYLHTYMYICTYLHTYMYIWGMHMSTRCKRNLHMFTYIHGQLHIFTHMHIPLRCSDVFVVNEICICWHNYICSRTYLHTHMCIWGIQMFVRCSRNPLIFTYVHVHLHIQDGEDS